MRKLLMPIDAQPISEALMLYLKDLVAGMDYEVTLLYVIPIERNLVHGDLMNFRESNKALFQGIAEDILNKSEMDLRAAGIEQIQKVQVTGDPAEEIIKFSEKESFHSILMRSHGMGATKRLLIGSVTNKVVHHSKIPVIVIQ